MQIDFVIPWVDGNDPKWRSIRNRYSKNPEDSHECRFRDWEILPFWFRAVETYAPWVHGIYFVTMDQIPAWLNTDHPKLHLIRHSDYIPDIYLPTFSSHTIELNFHRIPGLSEYFVYFNDDMFLNPPVDPEDFFYKGLPRDHAVLCNFCPMEAGDAYTHAQCNVMAVINRNFDKRRVLLKDPEKWFDPRDGKDFLKNVYGAATKFFSNFANQHLPSSMLKSTYEKVWQLELALLDQTCRNRFRSLGDVNQYIMSYYNLCCGNFRPRPTSFGKCYSIGRQSAELHRDIRQGIHKTVCINDNPGQMDFDREKSMLLSLYREKFPNKSSFERET